MYGRDGANEEWWVESVGYEKETSGRAKRMEARSKLYEVLKHYGYKKPKGFGKQWVQCPFHQDEHASGAVDWQTNYFSCFACEARGTAIDLVMQQEGKTRDDAAEFINLL